MGVSTINMLSVCTGYGGLDLGVDIATGGRTRVVCYVEREAYAISNLAAKMEQQALDAAPVWTDLTTFDGRPWRGVVDCITSGLPCQPYSLAGRRQGHDDERAIWPEFMRIVGEVRPALVFLENVPAFLRWFREPGEVLSGMGYRIEKPLLLSASDVGANHKRQRVWILAHAERGGFTAETRRPQQAGQWRAESSGGNAPDADNHMRSEDTVSARWNTARNGDSSHAVSQRQRQPQGCIADIGRRDLNGGAEHATDADEQGLEKWPQRNRRPGERLSESSDTVFGPWIPTWWDAESGTRGLHDGCPNRVDRLRLGGNGVVPLQAAYAFAVLATEAGYGEIVC